MRIGVLLLLAAAPAAAQAPDQPATRPDSLREVFEPAAALAWYRAVLAADSGQYDALWKAALALVNMAKLIEDRDDASRQRRDSLYAEAAALARRAIRRDSLDAEGHFVLALSLGRLSRTRGGRERLRYARQIYHEAERAVALDSLHDGAHHVLGAWHAEARRLSGATRFLARTLLGGGFLSRANWDTALVHLERAVELRPGYVFHRLELAEVYIDRQRWADARRQLAAIPGLPELDPLDSRHKRRAEELLEEIAEKK